MMRVPDDIASVRRFQQTIIAAAEEKLARRLTSDEESFITRRGGFIALEMIADSVSAGEADEIQRYLNSENHLPPIPRVRSRGFFKLLGFVLAFLVSACGKNPQPPLAADGDAPHLKIAVFADGRLNVDGKSATVAELHTALETLKKNGGVVWYYREAGEQEPPPIAMQVMREVADARLPVRLSSRPDYSTAIGPDGRSQ